MNVITKPERLFTGKMMMNECNCIPKLEYVCWQCKLREFKFRLNTERLIRKAELANLKRGIAMEKIFNEIIERYKP